MPVAPNAVMSVTWKGLIWGQITRHVRHWRLASGGGGPADLLDYANAMITAIQVGGPADFTTAYRNCLTNDWKLQEYRAQVISPVRGAYGYLVPGAITGGTRPASQLTNIQASVEAATAYGGRSQVACYKIGPISYDDTLHGETTALLDPFLGVYAGTFTLPVTLTGTAASVWNPCIYHYRKPALAIPYDDIRTAGARNEVRVKNTRTVRRGE